MTRLGLLAVALIVAGPVLSAQQEPSADTVVRHGHGARVHIGSDVYVAEHERVDAAVAILGSVTVDGEVNDDVVAVGGDVKLGPKAIVHGSVTSVGGSLNVAPESRVFGGRQEVSVRVPNVNIRWPDWPHVAIAPLNVGRWWAGFALSATLARMLLIGLVALFALLVAQGPVVRLGDRVARAPVQATVIGIGVQILLVPVIVGIVLALVISILGIPLLALLPIALLVGLVVWVGAFAGVVQAIGRRLLGAGETVSGAVAGFIVGLGVVWTLTLVARAAWFMTGSSAIAWPVLSVLGLAGTAIEFLAWSAALGGLVLRRLDRYSPAPLVAPPPPPPPPPAEPVQM